MKKIFEKNRSHEQSTPAYTQKSIFHTTTFDGDLIKVDNRIEHTPQTREGPSEAATKPHRVVG